MTFSSNTAQARDMSELRNHLKWLDDERRKTAKKLTELEQRLAQQGRELAEREQRIQELEWQLSQVNERVDRLPEVDNSAAAHEQRLQDLEWHLSNVNAQLVRLPKLDDELVRFRDDLTRTTSDLETRLWSSQNTVLEQLQAQTELNGQAVRTAERDINDLAARLAMLPQFDDELLALRTRLDSLPVIDVAAMAALEERIGELEGSLGLQAAAFDQAMKVQEAAYDQLSRSNVAMFDNRVLTLEQQLDLRATAVDEQIESRIAAVDAQVESRLAAVDTQVESRLAALNEQLLLRVATLEQDATARDEQLNVHLATVEAETASKVQGLQAQFGLIDERLADNSQLIGLGAEVADLRARLDAIPNFDSRLAVFQEDVMKATAEYEARTVAAQEEVARATAEYEARAVAAQEEARRSLQEFMDSAQFPMAFERIERLEESLTALPAIREAVIGLTRLEQELEMREAEDARLNSVLGVQEAKIGPLVVALEELKQQVDLLQRKAGDADTSVEQLRAGLVDLNENWKPSILEARNRLIPLGDRVATLNLSLPRLEAALEAVTDDQATLREALTSLGDHVKVSQQDVTRQIESWQAVQDEQKDTIERFTQQWLTLSNQYKEARMAVQNFAHWQKQLEQQKREATELVRIESNRLQSRWEGFLLEFQEKLKNSELDLAQKWQSFEMDNEQRWTAVRRTEQQWRDELAAIDELILKLQQDNRNLIWRVQAAQADAIKKWPRLLLEEVEKAVELNPQRRLQPAAGTISRTDISVADALEQGLIKIDYDDTDGA